MPFFRDDDDHFAHLDLIANAMGRFDAQVLIYCLKGNHCHLMLHTRAPNLSRLTRHVYGNRT